jgi:hypothetical protein
MAWFPHPQTYRPTQTSTAMNLRRLSCFVTMTLCAFTFLFATPSTSLAEAKIVGTLKVKGTVLQNKKPSKNGTAVRNGDLIETGPNQTAIVTLSRGGYVFIKKHTRVRIFDHDGEPVEFLVVFGGIDLRGLDNKQPNEWPAGWIGSKTGENGETETGAEPLPFLAAFGFGNFSFPSIGGGSSSSSGSTVSVTLPNGEIALYSSLGQFIGFK